MYTISDNYTYEYIVKKSKFIVKLIKIDDCDIESILDKIKDDYPKATHYCFAYTLKNYSKYNDDGEPSGTAGLPILNSLNSRNLVNVLCVVIRYFGGIKLGASGLIRTYGKVVRDSIDASNLIELIDYVDLNITFDYDKVNIVNNLLKDYIVSKNFNEKINYQIKLPKNLFDEFNKIFKEYNIDIEN